MESDRLKQIDIREKASQLREKAIVERERILLRILIDKSNRMQDWYRKNPEKEHNEFWDDIQERIIAYKKYKNMVLSQPDEIILNANGQDFLSEV